MDVSMAVGASKPDVAGPSRQPTSCGEPRVAEVRSAVDAGAYRVSGEDIAAAMLRDPAVKATLTGGWHER
jgi:anti-sigma28 factor (negative regulator of flagellin synthesis)